ncbi:CoB--CoM heterodisulfide reductase iron-sulfur subunit A family protein [Prolixibacteraceae bacterium Z1-6]|uniref:CoB--CoM heterodisulfide reductase iron-sulfur subunit A family protein n=1 Tax=Draconibacterium aestuarii TaxID=2998507 RepID=A0A9X3F940_9BACT|nr:CoB--CoM heterodisulfide reductase iron-sulfur subunit A family protein [Prolixibacteraceae bacterium Z1-6]
MRTQETTGMFLYHPGNGHLDKLNFTELFAYSESHEDVAVVWDSKTFPLWDIEYLKSQIQKYKLSRIIIAGYDTGMVKPIFARVFSNLQLNVENILLEDFKEHGILESGNTELGKALLSCAIYNVALEDILPDEEKKVCTETLIIGAGIAGIQAALEIANANHKVHLIERTGTIGGHMAMFDKTFPTLDCAACILTPKMVEIGQHPSINLLTYSEVQSVTGTPGNFKVKVLQKARRVSLSKCIGCGSCAEKCPGKARSEFDVGTTFRKAIYIPFPQAVPNKYLIDAEACRYVQGKKCGVCVKNCPVPGCIDLDEKDSEIELCVGNIIIATGFKTFEATKLANYGYGSFPNVLTSLEFERLTNAAGPTEGKITFRTQNKKGDWIFSPQSDSPERVGIIHCVGSRDINHNQYCSRVCCMYSLKLAHLVKEKIPDAEVYEYYIDMRSFGKGYEAFYERIKSEGVHLLRGKPAEVRMDENNLIIRSEDIDGRRLLEQKVDMVILSVGLEPAAGSAEIAKLCGVTTDSDGWMDEANYVTSPVNTFAEGVLIAGLCQGPKDIPDTVAQASAAASEVLQHIVRTSMRKNIPELPLAEIRTRAKNLSLKMEDRK